MGEHHHTHHHHKEDGASRFKHKSLAAIRKRKQMAKDLEDGTSGNCCLDGNCRVAGLYGWVILFFLKD